MNGIKELRTGFGLTQAVFADILGVKRSVISMAESGRRPLPTDAMIKFGQLQITSRKAFVSEPDEQTAQWLHDAAEEYHQSLISQLKQYEQLLTNATEQLEAMQLRHQRVCESLKLLTAERSLFEGVPSYMNRLNAAHADAWEEFRKTHAVSRKPVELRIAELKALTDIYRNELKKVELT